MRWRGSTLAAVTVVVAGAATTLAGVRPVDASCHGRGTLPDSQRVLVTVEVGTTTVYVDDRSALHRDGGGGLFVYLESNGRSSLQTGGPQVAFSTAYGAGVPAHLPKTGLFPLPTDGETWHGVTGMHDECYRGGAPDTLLF